MKTSRFERVSNIFSACLQFVFEAFWVAGSEFASERGVNNDLVGSLEGLPQQWFCVCESGYQPVSDCRGSPAVLQHV